MRKSSLLFAGLVALAPATAFAQAQIAADPGKGQAVSASTLATNSAPAPMQEAANVKKPPIQEASSQARTPTPSSEAK